ncbi:MAG: YdeI/OmpD-associated family protein [Sulfitobacter sp.]
MQEPAFFHTQDAFNDWMEGHCTSADELWVGYYKKNTGRPSISWSASVDVALCFGWIDGIRKSIDDQSYKIRFTPRKQNSVWSAVNVQKVNVLIDAGKMKPAGLQLFHARSDKEGYTSQSRNVLLDPAFEAQFMANQTAWAFFSSLAPSYKRDSIWWVMSAKRAETRRKRFGILMVSSHDGLKIPLLRK